jgi:CBS domain-containing protein
MRVKDVMTQHPICCHAGDSAQSVAKAFRDEDIGSLPVIADGESNQLEGIITDRDLCCTIVAEGLDPKTTPIATYVRRNPITCRAEHSLDACERLMQMHQVRRVPVVDQRGCCIGMVSQADLARSEQSDKVHRTLSEISKPARTIIAVSIMSQRAV